MSTGPLTLETLTVTASYLAILRITAPMSEFSGTFSLGGSLDGGEMYVLGVSNLLAINTG
jgi:hypothetical protein